MTKKRAVYLIAMFLILIFGISAVNLFKGTTQMSVYENRNLAKRPGLIEIKNGDFASKYESYYADQFIGRDAIIKLNTMLDIFSGKSIVKSMYITKQKWLFPQLTVKVNKEGIIKQAARLDEFRNELKAQGKSLQVVFTPYRGHVLSYMYPSYASGLDAIPQNLKTYTGCLDAKKINYTDIDDYLINNYSKKELESFYFKTDHHWNMSGAYEGFKYIIETMAEDDPMFKDLRIEDKDYKKTYIKNKVFSGSYNSNLYSLIKVKEQIPYFENVNNQDYKQYIYENGTFVEKKHEGMFFSGRDKKTITYDSAYALGLAYYKITNKAAKTDKKILIFRDSYQSATARFFADIFKEVIVIDPRYVDDVNINARKMALSLDVDVVMPMFNSQTFSTMISLMLK